jgi:hypothetical protein
MDPSPAAAILPVPDKGANGAKCKANENWEASLLGGLSLAGLFPVVIRPLGGLLRALVFAVTCASGGLSRHATVQEFAVDRECGNVRVESSDAVLSESCPLLARSFIVCNGTRLGNSPVGKHKVARHITA